MFWHHHEVPNETQQTWSAARCRRDNSCTAVKLLGIDAGVVFKWDKRFTSTRCNDGGGGGQCHSPLDRAVTVQADISAGNDVTSCDVT